MMQRAIDIIQDDKSPEEIRKKIRDFQRMAKVCASFTMFETCAEM